MLVIKALPHDVAFLAFIPLLLLRGLQANRMLVTKALSHDVTVLAFVPSFHRKLCSVAKGAADSYPLAASATIH